MKAPTSILQFWLALALGLVVLSLGYMTHLALGNLRDREEDADWVAQIQEVILQADALHVDLHAAEAALRGYLLTRNPEDQFRYREAYSETVAGLQILEGLTVLDGEQAARVRALSGLISEKVDQARSLVAASVAEDEGKLRELLAGEEREEVNQRVRDLLVDIKAQESRRLQERNWRAVATGRATERILYSGLALNFLLVVMVLGLVRNHLKARDAVQRALREANEGLECRVKERTAELDRALEDLEERHLALQWESENLRRLVEQTDQILNATNVAVFAVGRGGAIIRANQFAARLCGVALGELAGRPVREILPLFGGETGGLSWERDPLQDCLRTGRELPGAACQVRLGDGTLRPVSVDASPFRAKGRVVGCILTCRESSGA